MKPKFARLTLQALVDMRQTQKELAARMGVSSALVCLTFRGDRRVSIDFARRLLRCLPAEYVAPVRRYLKVYNRGVLSEDAKKFDRGIE